MVCAVLGGIISYRMSLRFWLNIITVVLVVLVVFLGWDQITQAWGLLGRVNFWVLILLVPVQFASYYAAGEVAFSYLRAKGELKTMSRLKMARISLELNFVNHIAIVPMAAGSSYFSWVLRRYSVGVGRSTMSQIIRSIMSLIVFVMFFVVAVVIVSFDYKINKTVIISVSALLTLAVIGVAILVYAISSEKRSLKLSSWSGKIINKIYRFITRKKEHSLVNSQKVDDFFMELHRDYLEILNEKKILLAPFLWSILFVLLDTFLIMIAFLALGFWVNPAALFIAFGLASIGTMFAVTPGGAGVYETIMAAFLISTGLPADIAIAGTLLARALLLTGTIGFGYIFYQLTINKYGKVNDKPNL